MNATRTGSGAVLFAALIIGCGHRDVAADTTASVSARTDSAAGSISQSLNTAVAPGIGRYLTDADGRAVYMFVRDSRNVSACSDACAAAWPPLAPSAGPSADTTVKAAMIGTITRGDARQQTTYNGMPVYYYEDDEHPGDIKGQGKNEFGGLWYLLSPNGKAITSRAQNTPAAR
jgi:predicted lipoprotein with Yx(FWY)xxD motif